MYHLDYPCVRDAQKEMGIDPRSKVSLEQFRFLWLLHKGMPRSDSDYAFLNGSGLRLFYEDYLCGPENAETYLEGTG